MYKYKYFLKKYLSDEIHKVWISYRNVLLKKNSYSWNNLRIMKYISEKDKLTTQLTIFNKLLLKRLCFWPKGIYRDWLHSLKIYLSWDGVDHQAVTEQMLISSVKLFTNVHSQSNHGLNKGSPAFTTHRWVFPPKNETAIYFSPVINVNSE